MPTFQEHIEQAKSNFDCLSDFNQNMNYNFWDWQVTISFYTALHLTNAHIFQKTGNSYTTHTQADAAINFANSLSLAKLPEDEYLAYTKLQMLSRRARYLMGEKRQISFTNEKHFVKAITYLDKLISYFDAQYKLNFPKKKMSCDRFVKTYNYIQQK